MYRTEATYKISSSSTVMLDEEMIYNIAKSKLDEEINKQLSKDRKSKANIERELITYVDITGSYEFTMIAREV